MARPYKPKHLRHDGKPLYPRLLDDDRAFMEAEALRRDIPINVLARDWLHDAIARTRAERRQKFAKITK